VGMAHNAAAANVSAAICNLAFIFASVIAFLGNSTCLVRVGSCKMRA